MQEENAHVTEYEKLLAGAKIDWKGKLLNLSMMTPYLNHEDREIRKKAAAKVNAFYEGIADQLDELYDKLVKNRTAQAKKLGFETYTDLGYCRMNRNSYGSKEELLILHLLIGKCGHFLVIIRFLYYKGFSGSRYASGTDGGPQTLL